VVESWKLAWESVELKSRGLHADRLAVDGDCPSDVTREAPREAWVGIAGQELERDAVRRDPACVLLLHRAGWLFNGQGGGARLKGHAVGHRKFKGQVHPVPGGVHLGKERSLVASIGVVIVGLRVLARLPQDLADLGMDNPKRVADVDVDVRFDAGQRHGSGHGVGDEEQELSAVESSDGGRSGWRLSARGGGELGPWAIDSLPVSRPHLRFIHRIGHTACLSPSPSAFCRACGRFRSSWNPCGSVQSICERHGTRHSANTVLLLSISETIAVLGSRAV